MVRYGWCKVIKVDGKLNPADIGTKDQKIYGKTWFKMLEKIGMGFPMIKKG